LLMMVVVAVAVRHVVQVGIAEQVGEMEAERLDRGCGDCADKERVLLGLLVRGLLQMGGRMGGMKTYRGTHDA
jgi:hypothetical protein